MSEQFVDEAPSPFSYEAIAKADQVTSQQAITGADAAEPPAPAEPPVSPAEWQAVINSVVQKVAQEQKIAPSEISARERLYRQALSALSFALHRVQPPPGMGYGFQLQIAWPARPGVPARPLVEKKFDSFSLALQQVQVATRIGFNSSVDYVTATTRFDARNRKVTQFTLEFKRPGPTATRLVGALKFEGWKFIVNADSYIVRDKQGFPGKLLGVPGVRGGQIGLGVTCSIFDVSFVLEGLLIADVSQIGINERALSDPSATQEQRQDFSRLLSIGINGQVTFPISKLFPHLRELEESVGGQWTVTVKVFSRVFATRQLWLKAASLVPRAATAVGTVASKAVALAITNPEVVVAVVALAGLVMTARGIYRDLQTPNYGAMLTSYIKGYVGQLDSALGQSAPELSAEIVRHAAIPVKELAEQIRAVMRKENLGKLYTPPLFQTRAGHGEGTGPSSHDRLFAIACSASEQIGRAVVLAEIAQLMHDAGNLPTAGRICRTTTCKEHSPS